MSAPVTAFFAVMAAALLLASVALFVADVKRNGWRQ